MRIVKGGKGELFQLLAVSEEVPRIIAEDDVRIVLQISIGKATLRDLTPLLIALMDAALRGARCADPP